MEDVHAVLDELVGRDLERILAFLDETALHAVLDVRELHAAVADRGAAMTGEDERILADLVRHRDGLALEKAHVAVDVADHLDVRGHLVVLVDEEADRRAQARGQSASRQKRNLLHFFRHCLSLFLST